MSTKASRWNQLSEAERFWMKVDKSGGPDACWFWLASLNNGGYGRFICADGSERPASTVAFIQTYGFQPPYVCHRCDNPPCCNPEHLFAGDAQINADDKVAKGRQNRGEAHASTKFNAEEIIIIRARFVPHDRQHGINALAREFSVSPAAIHRIVHGKSWKHLPSSVYEGAQ